MYAQLGDIKFEKLFGPDKYSDTQETVFAEHALIKNKPKLQSIGEKLQEITIGIKFHTAFCDPITEFNKLNNHRKNAEVLTYIWGTGDIEGDFVITSIKRNIDALGPDGGMLEITCDVSLKEAYDSNKVTTEKKLAVKNAFATDDTVPLPAIESTDPPTDAVAAVNALGKADLDNNNATGSLDNAVKSGNSFAASGVIAQAQGFVDVIATKQSAVIALINSVSDSVNLLGAKLSGNPALGVIAPLLSAQISTSASVVTSAQTLVALYAGMPNPVTTLTQATNILGIIANTGSIVTQLRDTMKDLKDKSQPIAVAVATRQIL